MRSFIFIILFLSVLTLNVKGQEKSHAISGRVGLSSGIAYQMMVDDFRGYKGLMTFRDGGLQITALIESYRPMYLNFTDRMQYYMGMGAHIGFTRWPPRRGLYPNPFYYRTSGSFAPVIGLDAIFGIEYRVNRIPLSFSLDAKPFFELFGHTIFRLSLLDIGLSIKVHF